MPAGSSYLRNANLDGLAGMIEEPVVFVEGRVTIHR